MGKLKLEGPVDAKKFTAAGALTIQDASTLKGLLMEAYNSTADLLLDLTGVQSLDLACLQVLCSANITYRKAGRHIGISGALPDGVTRSLKNIAVEPDGCDLESPCQCLWATRGGDE
jgi:ABC-type transporter Mla MlaB component